MNVRFVGLAHGTAGRFDRAMPLEEPGMMIAAIEEYHAAFRSGFSGVLGLRPNGSALGTVLSRDVSSAELQRDASALTSSSADGAHSGATGSLGPRPGAASGSEHEKAPRFERAEHDRFSGAS